MLVIGGGTIGASVAISSAQKNNIVEAEAIGDNITRIYAVLEGDWDNRDNNDQNRMYLHTWTDGGAETTWPGYEMTRVLGKYSLDPLTGYYAGLFYADVTLYDNIILNNGNTFGKGSNQSITFLKADLTTYVGGEYVAPYISEWLGSDETNRVVKFNTIGCNAKQAAQLFSSSHVDICNDYDLYPLMNDLFIKPSNGWETTENEAEGTRYNTSVISNEYDGKTSFTLDAVLNQFERQYNIHSTSTSNIAIIKEEDFATIVATSSIISLSTIGLVGFVLFKRKSHI